MTNDPADAVTILNLKMSNGEITLEEYEKQVWALGYTRISILSIPGDAGPAPENTMRDKDIEGKEE